LVANDQEWSGRSFETILGPRGFAVLRAYTANQLLEATRATQPDLLVLDARMADIDGVELCRRLRADGVVSLNTPIIITSASQPSRAQRLAAYEAGAWDYVHHPIDGESLVLKLETFVNAKREADRLRDDSLVDDFTGLYSVRGLARRARELAAEALRSESALACVALAPEAASPDVARDKSAFELLVEAIAENLGAALLKNARASDVLGHLGRSEFAVIAPATPPDGAQRLMGRLQSSLEATPITIDGTEHRFKMRGGYFAVANYALSTIDPVEMLERASSALRAAPRTDLPPAPPLNLVQ